MQVPPFFSRSRTSSSTAKGVADFLQQHGTMSHVVPVVQRLTALKKDCLKIAPAIFESCDVLSLEDGRLVLACATPALAARLKQQSSQLQHGLQKRGWQVNAIRLKVQIPETRQPLNRSKQIALTQNALQAFAELDAALSQSSKRTALHEAVANLLKKHTSVG
ncbi:MAG: hypothetical protein K0S28_2160 [Paucimonas sp.]|jgi:hypothetical protein|nr:hypothetical protein [Paucimonas sp.]